MVPKKASRPVISLSLSVVLATAAILCAVPALIVVATLLAVVSFIAFPIAVIVGAIRPSQKRPPPIYPRKRV